MASSLKLKLLRGDTALVDMPSVDENNMLDVPSIKIGTLLDTKNDIKVSFTKRDDIEGVTP